MILFRLFWSGFDWLCLLGYQPLLPLHPAAPSRGDPFLRHLRTAPADLGGASTGPCTLPTLDVHVGNLDVEGKSAREGVQGLQEFLVPRECQNPGSPLARIGVVIGELFG